VAGSRPGRRTRRRCRPATCRPCSPRSPATRRCSATRPARRRCTASTPPCGRRLNAAVRAGLIPVNPGRWPELPKATRPRPQVWTPALAEQRQRTYAKRIAVLAAYAAANTFLGERFRRLSSRPGGGGRKKAGCAVGRSILIIVWHLLNDPAARYQDLGSDWHARHTDRSRKARNARRQLEALGYHVIITLREDAA
jgi:hypothetical protein